MHLATRSTCLLCVAVVVAACSDDSTLPPTAPTTGPPRGVSLSMRARPQTAHTRALGRRNDTSTTRRTRAFSFSPRTSARTRRSHSTKKAMRNSKTPSSPTPRREHNGLGPVFDNVSCEGCHAGDGRGRPPGPGEIAESFLVRISYPGRDLTTGATEPGAGIRWTAAVSRDPGN